MIELVKGIGKKMPASRFSENGWSKYPFPTMEINDGVIVNDKDIQPARLAASKTGRVNGWKFCSRKQEDGSVVIWRVA